MKRKMPWRLIVAIVYCFLGVAWIVKVTTGHDLLADPDEDEEYGPEYT